MEEFISTLLNLPLLSIHSCEIRDNKIYIYCASKLGESYCPVCLGKCNKIKDSYVREIRDLSISGKKVYLQLTTHQYHCSDCNRHFYEQFDFVRKGSTMTNRYEDYINFRCQGVDLQHVVVQEDIRWERVNSIFQRYSQEAIKQRDAFSNVEKMGMDEIALRKGHKDYVVVLVNLDTGEVLDILPDRSKAYLINYFRSKGETFCNQITCFCSDMWEGYLNCAAEVFPNAVITADRFHYFHHLQKQVDKCRKDLRKKYPDDESLKNTRYSLLKREENLTDKDINRLVVLFSDSKFDLLKQTWIARNEFQDILDTDLTRQEAEIKITEWQNKYRENTYIDKFIQYYTSWKDYILNYFVFRHTTSLIEGINNKLKVIKRRAYGFLNFEHFRHRAIMEFI